MNAAAETSAASNLAHVFAQYPFEVASANDVWLQDASGRRVLDLYGGHAVAALGYGHPRWLAALEQQARSVAFQTNAVPMEIRERAAHRLVQFAGLSLNQVFFINSGAEANENALRLAFKLTGRSEVVALEQGWHGRTAAAGAISARQTNTLHRHAGSLNFNRPSVRSRTRGKSPSRRRTLRKNRSIDVDRACAVQRQITPIHPIGRRR